MKHTVPLLALSLALAAAPALADDDCEAPVQKWQSRDAVMQHAAAQGWQVQRLKIDDGCYEVRGIDAQGKAFKAKIDPETLKVLKLKAGDRRHTPDGDNDRDDQGAARHARPPKPEAAAAPAASASPPPASPPTSGTATRSQTTQ